MEMVLKGCAIHSCIQIPLQGIATNYGKLDITRLNSEMLQKTGACPWKWHSNAGMPNANDRNKTVTGVLLKECFLRVPNFPDTCHSGEGSFCIIGPGPEVTEHHAPVEKARGKMEQNGRLHLKVD